MADEAHVEHLVFIDEAEELASAIRASAEASPVRNGTVINLAERLARKASLARAELVDLYGGTAA